MKSLFLTLCFPKQILLLMPKIVDLHLQVQSKFQPQRFFLGLKLRFDRRRVKHANDAWPRLEFCFLATQEWNYWTKPCLLNKNKKKVNKINKNSNPAINSFVTNCLHRQLAMTLTDRKALSRLICTRAKRFIERNERGRGRENNEEGYEKLAGREKNWGWGYITSSDGTISD